MRVPPGGRIGAFEVVRELARGGQGVVYVARRPGSAEEVALKLLLDDDPEVRQRFAREARTLARLEHPNLIRLVEAGELPEGVAYLAMELVAGRDLDTELRERGPLDPERAAERVATLAEALHYCHEQGVVHRDLKPGNVLVEEGSGRVVLVDFGLVRRRRLELAWSTQDLDSLTQVGEVLGTPGFMAPEQISPEWGEVDRRADVYALGATLFALLTGLPPFRGSLFAVLDAVLNQAPPDPRALRPEIPSALSELCLRCLEKDPDLRPRNALAVAEALRGANRGPASRGRPWLLAGAAMGVALLGGAFAWRSPPSEELARDPSTPTSSPSLQPSRRPSSAAPAPSVAVGLAELRRRSAARDPNACNALADLFLKGGQVEKDPAAAAALYRVAAEQGHTLAMFNLGVVLREGVGVPRDEAESVSWFRRAAEGGHPVAMVMYAGKLLTSRENLAEGVALLERAAAQGNAAALAALGRLHETGLGVPNDPAAALSYFRRAAAGGDPGGMAALGRYLYKGIHVEPDRAEAQRLFEAAWRAGSHDVPYLYSKLLDEIGQAAKSHELLAQGVAQGSSGALLRKGELLEAGTWPGVTGPDLAGAFACYFQAAERNYPPALARVAQCYLEGRGTKRNAKLAQRCALQAARLGSLEGASLLAQIYIGRQEFARARPWAKSAAQRGFVTGMVQYAGTLLFSEPTRPEDAQRWLGRASEAENLEACVHYAELALDREARDLYATARGYLRFALPKVEGRLKERAVRAAQVLKVE